MGLTSNLIHPKPLIYIIAKPTPRASPLLIRPVVASFYEQNMGSDRSNATAPTLGTNFLSDACVSTRKRGPWRCS